MKLLLIFTSLFALGNMEQPLHVYTSEEIRLDELAKLDELGNTGNGKKEVVDPKEENTGYNKKKQLILKRRILIRRKQLILKKRILDMIRRKQLIL